MTDQKHPKEQSKEEPRSQPDGRPKQEGPRPRRRFHAGGPSAGGPSVGHSPSRSPGGHGGRQKRYEPRRQHSLHAPRGGAERGFDRGGDESVPIPPLAPGVIRVIPLGGVEEIGRNMTSIEIGNDIIIIDCGFQFREDDTPGIDYILPNAKYLEDRKEKIRGIFITHGHLDHIGGIPYIIEKLGYPPIYSRRLTTMMVRKRQEEFPYLKPLNIIEVEKEEIVRVGNLKLSFFSVTHTIPDSMGIIIETPYGDIVHTGDLKLEHVAGVPTEREEKEYARFAKKKVLLLLSDSTNTEEPGFSTPEETVSRKMEEIIGKVEGRIIIGTFSSQLERMVNIIAIAERHGKKIVVEGRSMKTNIEIVQQLGMLTTKKGTFISSEEMFQYPPGKIVVLATGAQGDKYAALMRMATKTHRTLTVQKNDTIVLSSSIVPGNERAVQKLKDNLSRQGAHIIHYKIDDVHSSGHANRDETAWIHRKIHPRFFIPIHGYHYMLRAHADIARSLGTPEKNIVIPDNSMVIEITEEGEKIGARKERAPSGLRMVDGFSIGDIQEVVIRARKALAEDGMFVIIATINTRTGKLRKSPDIISRGFVYLRESQELLQQTRIIITKTIDDTTAGTNPINFDQVKNNVTDAVSRFLFQKTNKRPLVIPVVLSV